MRLRKTLTSFILATGLVFALSAWAQQKPLTQDQVQSLVRSGLGDKSGAKLIKQRGIDFTPTEDFLQSLKAAGASEGFLNALRAFGVETSEPGGSTQSKQKDTPLPTGITLCVAPIPGNFDGYLIGEMRKQKVPATIIAADLTKGCDPAKSYYTLTGSQEPEGKSFSARSIFGLRVHYRNEIQAAVKLIRNSDSVIVWAGASDRAEMTKVAEHIVNQMLEQRPIWIPSPLNR